MAKFYKNGELRPSSQDIKTFIDLQVEHLKNNESNMSLGSYQWAAQAVNVSTRTVRYWCDPNNAKGPTYAEWFLLRLVGGSPLETPDPLREFQVAVTSS